MKSLIATTILLVLTIAAIIVNAIYVESVAAHLQSMLDDLPPVGDPTLVEKTTAVSDYWDKNVNFVGLSVGYSVIDRVSEQAAVLIACAEAEDYYGYASALALLRDTISDTHRLEHFSVGNLL